MYVEFKKSVQSNIANYYSDFVSCVLRDIPSVIVPIQRISNNHYFNQLAEIKKIEKNKMNYFSKISNMYKKIQNAPQNYQIQDFLREINDFM